MTVANLVCHDTREFRFVIGAKRRHPKVRQALEDLAVEFRKMLREWRGLILQTDRGCGRYSFGDCDVTPGACP